ncbi:DUF6934 family protein [Dyadobacter beijingensis]|nr:hypothetical protein [Dyadobacter beijingensis]
MNKDIYHFQSIEDSSLYTFTSEGIHGKIHKVVLMSPLIDELNAHFDPLFNLAFGDIVRLKDSWVLDDSIRTGNGDMPKVIATVAAIAIAFLEKHPHSTLSFQGYMDPKSAFLGKNQRNILYQRGINSNWEELSAKLRFWGVKAGKFESYTRGSTYDRILANRK